MAFTIVNLSALQPRVALREPRGASNKHVFDIDPRGESKFAGETEKGA